MAGMGPLYPAMFGVFLLILPDVARAQGSLPAAAFPASPPASAAAPAAAAPAAAAPATSTPAPPAGTSAAAPSASPAPAARPALPPPPPPPPGPPTFPGTYPALPPPPAYPYGYYYYPPPPPPPPRFAEDAAVSSTPFVDATLVGLDWQRRFSEPVNVGVQAGVFVAGRLRLTAKIAFPTEDVRDSEGQFGRQSKQPSFFYAFSAGVAAVRTSNFVMSPGLMLARADVADFGTMLGVSLPLDWVTSSGLRLGLEGGLGRAIGGRSVVGCTSDCSLPPSYEDRRSGSAVWFQFHVGFGFNHPAPLPPTAGPPR